MRSVWPPVYSFAHHKSESLRHFKSEKALPDRSICFLLKSTYTWSPFEGGPDRYGFGLEYGAR